MISLKGPCAPFFFFFLSTVLSLPQPNRQQKGKCYFTNISKPQTASMGTLLVN